MPAKRTAAAAKAAPARKAVAKKAVAKKAASAGSDSKSKAVAAPGKSVAVRDGSGSPRRFALGPDVDLDREVVLDGRGRRITNASAEAATADALAKVGRGRPSLSGEPGSGSPQVTFRLPAKLRAKVERRAAAEGKKVSELAREALERYLA